MTRNSNFRGPPVKGVTDLSIYVHIFIISLFIPIHLYIGDVRLSFYRLTLLIFVFELIRRLASDPIKFNIIDYFIMLYGAAGVASLLATGASISAQGIFFIEATLPYFLARTCIRSPQHFTLAMRTLVIGISFTLPFALYESLTSDPIILSLLGKLFPTIQNVPHEIRLGLDRAQVTFDHPILYGLFCSLGITVAMYATALKNPEKPRFKRGIWVSAATLFSLSSGAFVSLGIQIALVTFDRLFKSIRRRWIILTASAVICLAVLEVASGRTLAQLLIPYISLNPGTAWTRIGVNTWAIDVILEVPWVGYGFNTDFPPPPWWVPTQSIDNFWLATAFRHGIPTTLFLLLAVVGSYLRIATRSFNSPELEMHKSAFLITIVGISIAAISVHFWNSMYCGFLFFLGAGQYLMPQSMELQAPSNQDVASDEDRQSRLAKTAPYRRKFD